MIECAACRIARLLEKKVFSHKDEPHGVLITLPWYVGVLLFALQDAQFFDIYIILIKACSGKK